MVREMMLPHGVSRFSLKNKVAVVIGGTGALGGAIARGYAAAGASVAVLGRNEKLGKACVKNIEDAGGCALFFKADALSKDDLHNARLAINLNLGLPDILVNAAGGNRPGAILGDNLKFKDLSIEAWKEVFDLNLIGGVLFPCQEFGSLMAELGRGSIINIASVTAHVPLTKVVAYDASKAAVLNLSQHLATYWAPYNVRVNTITPGFFPANQNKGLLFEGDGSLAPRGKAIIAHTPMGRFGKAEELVGAAIYLASDSGFVTGTDIRVDGGFLSNTI